jgi:hypothetical protein
MLRIGVAVAPGDRQPFSVRCTQCNSVIRGKLITTEDSDVSAELDESQLLSEEASGDWRVITTHPAFPFIPQTVNSPFLEISNVLGKAARPYFQTVGEFNALAMKDWPKLERSYQFYAAEDWDRFDNSMSGLLGDGWPDLPDMIMRHDLVHRLLTFMIFPLDPSGMYAALQKEIWERAEPSQRLVDYVIDATAQSQFAALQKRLFSQIAHLINIRHLWMPSIPFLWLNRLGYNIPLGWRLPGDDFAVLRGVYQQNFELSCQALPMLVVAQNSADGRVATVIRADGESSPWVPPQFPESLRSPRTLSQFEKLNAVAKEAFLDRFPLTEAAWNEAFDRNIRNAIAHADADTVVATGDIMTGKGINLSYMEFVESIVKQLQLLLLWLNLAKLFRVYAVLAGRGQT